MRWCNKLPSYSHIVLNDKLLNNVISNILISDTPLLLKSIKTVENFWKKIDNKHNISVNLLLNLQLCKANKKFNLILEFEYFDHDLVAVWLQKLKNIQCFLPVIFSMSIEVDLIQ